VIIKVFILYLSAHYPQPIVAEGVINSWELSTHGASVMWGEDVYCEGAAEQTLQKLGFELADDDHTANYVFYCTENERT